MAFVRKKSSTFKWPVSVQYPTDGGRFETESFDAVFKRLGRKEFQRLVDLGENQLIEAVLKGWEGITDESGKEIPFSHSELNDLLDDPCFIKGLVQSYLSSLEGEKAKN